MKLFSAVLISIIVFSGFACSASQSAPSSENSNHVAADNGSPAQTLPAAQEKPICTLTLAGAPDLKGLRLGMTPEQVLALFPGSEQDAELHESLAQPPSQFGVSGFVIRPEKYGSKEMFAGIGQITFSLLDGHVSSLSAGYNGPQWPHVDKFVAKVAEGTNLPAIEAWEDYVGMESQLKILKCADFEMRVFAGGTGGNLNYVLLKDTAAAQKLKERRQKAEAAATPETKPPK